MKIPDENNLLHSQDSNCDINSQSQQPPLSVWSALLVLFLIDLWIIRAVWKSAIAGSWGYFTFFFAFTCALSLLIPALYRGSSIGWLLCRNLARLMGTICGVPFIYAIASILYVYAGGVIPDDLSYVTKVLVLVGMYALIPCAIFWFVYGILGTKQARQFCHAASGQ